jgi:hypothetical protein
MRHAAPSSTASALLRAQPRPEDGLCAAVLRVEERHQQWHNTGLTDERAGIGVQLGQQSNLVHHVVSRVGGEGNNGGLLHEEVHHHAQRLLCGLRGHRLVDGLTALVGVGPFPAAGDAILPTPLGAALDCLVGNELQIGVDLTRLGARRRHRTTRRDSRSYVCLLATTIGSRMRSSQQEQ